MARARPVPGLREEGPFAEAAAKVVAVRAAELSEHSASVLDMTDIERVHDMRVATRRLRAALEVFEPCFPRKQFKRVLRDVKQLADALGERRDPDVTIKALSEFSQVAGKADRPGIESMIERLRREQAEANSELAAHVAPERLAALGERVKELVEAAASESGEAPTDGLDTVAVERIPPPLSTPLIPAGRSNGAGEQ